MIKTLMPPQKTTVDPESGLFCYKVTAGRWHILVSDEEEEYPFKSF